MLQEATHSNKTGKVKFITGPFGRMLGFPGWIREQVGPGRSRYDEAAEQGGWVCSRLTLD